MLARMLDRGQETLLGLAIIGCILHQEQLAFHSM